MEREFMEKVLNKLDVLSLDVSGMKSDVNEMKLDINELKNDMNGQKAFSIRVLENFDKVFVKLDEHDKLIKANTQEIKSIKDTLKANAKEMAEIKDTLKANAKEMAEIKDTVKANTKEIVGIKDILKANAKEMAEIKDTVKTNTKEIGKIKDFLIVKEDELFNKIRALFDGYNSNYEKETDLEVRQKDTEQKVGINSLRISMLEETSKHHTEQISNLLAK